jgi:plastocyanin
MRVLLAVVVVAAGGLAWADLVAAAGKEINATIDPAKCDKTWGPPCFTPANGTVTQVTQGDTVTWRSLDGTHTVTPVDPAAFTGSGDLTGPDGTFSVTFDKVGVFSFYCEHHGSVEDGGKTHHGMWGRIDVRPGDTTTTSAPAPPPGNQPPPPSPDPAPAPPPGPAHPPTPPPSGSPPPATSNGSSGPGGSGGNGQTAAGSGRPWVGPPPTQAAPPPTRAAFSGPPPTEGPAKPKEKERETSSDSTSPPEATAVPPDEAVLPPSPQFPTPTTAPLAQNPGDAPHGDTIAVLKNEPGGHRRRLILFGTLFGVGVFAAGVGGWKYVNRPSKYWPA